MVNDPRLAKLEAFRRLLVDRSRGEPWHHLALAMLDAGATGIQDDLLRKYAADISGLSRSLVTRYLSTIRRVEAAAAAAGLPIQALLSSGYNAVEAAVRLYEHDPHEGLAALRGLADGSLSGAQLQRSIARSFEAGGSAFGDRSRTMRRRGLELDAVGRAIRAWASTSLTPDASVLPRPSTRFFRSPGWEVWNGQGACLAGVGVLGAGAGMSDRIDAVLAETALLSTFFPHYYLAVPPDVEPELAAEIGELLDFLEIAWIGVLQIGADLAANRVRLSTGRPVPDRTGIYESFRSRFARRTLARKSASGDG